MGGNHCFKMDYLKIFELRGFNMIYSINPSYEGSRHMIRGKVILTCQMIFYMMIFSHVLDAQVLCRS